MSTSTSMYYEFCCPHVHSLFLALLDRVAHVNLSLPQRGSPRGHVPRSFTRGPALTMTSTFLNGTSTSCQTMFIVRLPPPCVASSTPHTIGSLPVRTRPPH